MSRAIWAGLLILAAGCASFRQGWNRAVNSRCAEEVSQFRDIQRDPGRYMKTLHAFRGDVTEARQVAGTLVLRMFIKNPSGDSPASRYDSILVVSPDSFNIPITAGDKGVYVLGRIGPSVSGDQSFGAQVDAFTLRMAAIKSPKGVWFEPSEREAYDYWRGCR